MGESSNSPVLVKVLAKDSDDILFECSHNKAQRLVANGQALWVRRKKPGIIRSRIKDLRPINMTRPLRTKLYGNCQVLSPEGDVMFHCNEDKINWYMERNLAEKIKDDPLTIQLKFKPNGPGHIGDEYYLTEKINKCVCCGTENQLTRHHVIPYCYRRYFPVPVKNHSYHDVLLMCVNCHDDYERHADRLKKELALKYAVPLTGLGWYCDRDLARVIMYAKTLKNQWDKIPEEKREKMLQPIREHYKKHDIEHKDLCDASGLDALVFTDSFAQHGEIIVQKVGDIEEFVKMWRRHFLNNMKPKHLPQYWDVERSIYRENVQRGYRS
jgi:hypothetical protein